MNSLSLWVGSSVLALILVSGQHLGPTIPPPAPHTEPQRAPLPVDEPPVVVRGQRQQHMNVIDGPTYRQQELAIPCDAANVGPQRFGIAYELGSVFRAEDTMDVLENVGSCHNRIPPCRDSRAR